MNEKRCYLLMNDKIIKLNIKTTQNIIAEHFNFDQRHIYCLTECKIMSDRFFTVHTGFYIHTPIYNLVL